MYRDFITQDGNKVMGRGKLPKILAITPLGTHRLGGFRDIKQVCWLKSSRI